MKRFILICGLSALSFALSLTGLLGASSASAASDFDNAYQTTDKLLFGQQHRDLNQPDVIDATMLYNHWLNGTYTDLPPGISSVQLSDCQSCESDINVIRQRFNSQKQNWIISNKIHNQRYYGYYEINIIYSLDDNLTIEFGTNGSIDFVTVKPPEGFDLDRVRQMRIYLTRPFSQNIINIRDTPLASNSWYYPVRISNTTPWIDSVPSTLQLPPPENNGALRNYIANVSNVIYPDDYSGLPIRDSVTPLHESKFTPNWVATKYENFKVEFSDSNFFTVDNNPFLCEEGLAPMIEYTITRDDTGEILDSGMFSASSALSYQFEKVPERRDYTITGNYTECPGNTFTDSSSWTFMFNEAGGQHIPSFYEMCFKADFPFIDMNGCIGALERVINTLSFGSFKVSNNWTHQPTCYQSQKLHQWINLPSQELCPQFSSDVRNTVTPFVTFALGLTTLLFITNRRDT